MPNPTTPRPIGELVEEVAATMTSDQVYALAARIAAAEARPPEQPAPFTLAASAALDVDATVRRAVAMWVDGAGIDADIFSAWYVPQLRRAGVPEPDALAALRRVTGWRPRSDHERLVAVARGMRRDGYPEHAIRQALAGLVVDEEEAA